MSEGPPRLGAYILPDNLSCGTLGDILIDCAQHAYPTLLSTAAVHVDAAFGDNSLTADDMKELRKAAGRNKAIVGSMASILRPGRAIQVSLQDNRWLRDTRFGPTSREGGTGLPIESARIALNDRKSVRR